jgi:type IV pilus assembly protein PilO
MALSDFRIQNLSRKTQIIIFGILALALAVLFYMSYLKNAVESRTALQTEVRQLEARVAQAQAIEARLDRFKKEVAEIEQRLEVMKSILPSQKETPQVLRSVQEMASSNNLKILKFTPQPVVPKDFYVDWPIEIQVEGNYNGLGRFFEKIGQSTRLIDVNKINIKGIDKSTDPAKTLTAVCTATTFVFREDQSANAAR